MSDMKKLNGMILLTPDSFLNLLTTLVNRFGSAGESMIFQMGLENGREFCRGILGTIGDSGDSFEKKLSLVIEHVSDVGWADMIVDEINVYNGSVKVILQDNVFKEICLKINLPQCYFLRGYLSGILKEVTNMDYSYNESQCIAEGEEHCSIRMIPDSSRLRYLTER